MTWFIKVSISKVSDHDYILDSSLSLITHSAVGLYTYTYVTYGVDPYSIGFYNTGIASLSAILT